ncbi:MAG: MBL fold metallo-hydrolase, partial [Thermoplasmata archaeon]|jgi:glyoxylase-like metal-dependent hydrolase (beta-lactamase superfamily II)
MENILDDVYLVRVPLPRSPLKYINSYIIAGENTLVIDTGFNTDISFNALNDALNELGIKNPRFFITHIHADHIGLVGRYKNNSGVLISGEEYRIIENSSGTNDYWLRMNEYLMRNGFPEEDLNVAFGILNSIFIGTYPDLLSIKFQPLREGDLVRAGKMDLRVIITPGHSPGHACLYDAKNKILFSGDHILFTITPNITWWPSLENSLESYMNSLNRIKSLDIERTLPGHGMPGGDPSKRIDEIIYHHHERLEEILNVLDGEMDAYSVASLIKWNVMNGEWNIFPKTQKYFALGETIAHLHYLEEKGKVKRIERNGKFFYKIFK